MFSQVSFRVTEMNKLSLGLDYINGNTVKVILYLNLLMKNGTQTFTCILLAIKIYI